MLTKEMMEKMCNVEPILGKQEMKAIGLAVISSNLAIAARRGRPVFMSGVARDINSLNGMAAGGMDMNTMIMLGMLGKDEKTAVKEVAVEADGTKLGDILERVLVKLDKLDKEVVVLPEHKEGG